LVLRFVQSGELFMICYRDKKVVVVFCAFSCRFIYAMDSGSYQLYDLPSLA
jgi:hypothetical protein